MNSYIGPDELIYNNDENGNIHSGGFDVNSIMMKNGFSPIITLNNANADQIGGAEKVSDLFNNLVIPNWALSYNYKNLYGGGIGSHRKEDLENEDDVITEDIHEKLLNLVRASEEEMKQIKKPKKYTKKNTNELRVKRKYTRKNIK
jgi:hypothetical protein